MQKVVKKFKKLRRKNYEHDDSNAPTKNKYIKS